MKLIEPSYVIESCPDGEEVLALLERAARVCYKSEERIDPGVRCPCANTPPDRRRCGSCNGTTWHREPSSYKLIRQIIDSQHVSVIEHCSATVRFICDRGISHELVRHRLCSFSQESTRYCNYSKGKFEGVNFIDDGAYLSKEQLERCRAFQLISEEHYLWLINSGLKPQFARNYLPNGIKTEVVTTANMREWRHIFSLRCSPRAHPQMRELMIPLHNEMRSRIPILFDDPTPHKYDVKMLRALMRDGVITKDDLRVVLEVLD